MSHRTIRIAHVINSLSVGGAQAMLLKLLRHLDRRSFAPCVYSLLAVEGPIASEIKALGIEVRELGMEQGLPNPIAVLRLARQLRRDRPDIVQTWMYHGDLVGGLAARAARGPLHVVWNIRNNTLHPGGTRRRTFWVVRACARLSRHVPDAIVCCSNAAFTTHASLGYDAAKIVVIPNGFDVDLFHPSATARISVRDELGIPSGAAVVGLVARFDPQKDHRTFVNAAERLRSAIPNVRFVLCGAGVTEANPQLVGWIRRARLTDACHLLGERSDVAAITAAFDIACSSSCGESFPNAVGEAMACGIPCVVTDVGDSAHLVGDAGCIVPPRDPDALADAWTRLLSFSARERDTLGMMARQRVVRHFSMNAVARRYEETYRHVCAPA